MRISICSTGILGTKWSFVSTLRLARACLQDKEVQKAPAGGGDVSQVQVRGTRNANQTRISTVYVDLRPPKPDFRQGAHSKLSPNLPKLLRAHEKGWREGGLGASHGPCWVESFG